MALPKTPMRTTPSFAFAYVERAIQEGIGRRQFGKAEQVLIIEHFATYDVEPSCAYCGHPDPTRWDHVIPVRMSGETVIGNMVLACASCDDSKQARPFRDWLRARGASDCESRISRIEDYMAAFGYSTPEVDGALTADEAVTLAQLRREALVLRQSIEEFLERVSSRRREETPEVRITEPKTVRTGGSDMAPAW